MQINNENNYKVVKSPSLSKRYESRFVIVNTDNGDILDDANGYGYKTPKKAHIGYLRKLNPNFVIERETKIKNRISKFTDENRMFIQELIRDALQMKQTDSTFKVDADFIHKEFKKKLFNFNDLQFKPRQFLKYCNNKKLKSIL